MSLFPAMNLRLLRVGVLATFAVTLVAREAHAQMEWVECDSMAIPLGPPGSWEEDNVGQPDVVRLDGRLYLWYLGDSQHSSFGLGLAVSQDTPCGFERLDGPILTNVFRVQGPAVVGALSGNEPVFDLWYGSSQLDFTEGWIGRATVSGGVVRRKTNEPVLEPTENWEADNVHFPTVIHDAQQGLYRMWYGGGPADLSTRSIGYAESRDGDHWDKSPLNPVLRPGGPERSTVIGLPSVLYEDASGTYEMWYVSGDGQRFTTAFARSLDGLTWTQYGHVLWTGPNGDNVTNPSVLLEGETYRLWFSRGSNRGIGYAESAWTVPRASFEVSPTADPLRLRFDAARSTTPATKIVSYDWEFPRDASFDHGEVVEHEFAAGRELDVILRVTDDAGAEGVIRRRVRVESVRARFIRGDCSDDGAVDISDAVCILEWLFASGGVPGCVAATNTNGDEATNVSDAIYLLNHLFGGGDAPAAPFPECGPGTLPVDEQLGCANPLDCQ